MKDTLSLLNEKLSPEQIADRRGLAVSTIWGHIWKLVAQKKWEFCVEQCMSKERIEEIVPFFKQAKSRELKDIVALSDETVSFNEARVVRTYLRRHS